MVLVKNLGHLMAEERKLANTLGLFIQVGIEVLPVCKISLYRTVAFHIIPNIDTFLPVKGYFPFSLFQGRTNIRDAAKGRRNFPLQAEVCFFRIVQHLTDFRFITARPQAPGNFLG